MVSVSTWSSPPSISPAAWWSSVSSTPSCQPQTPQGWRSSLWGGCPDLSPPVSCNPGSPCRLSMECAQKERERCKCCNFSLLFSSLFCLSCSRTSTQTNCGKFIKCVEDHLHADAAHHFVRGGQVTVGGKRSSVSCLQLDVEQVCNVA